MLTTSNVNSAYSDSIATDSIAADSAFFCAASVEDAHAAPSLFVIPPDSTLIHYPCYLQDGEPGTPIPYNISTDNMLTASLLLLLMSFVVILAKSAQSTVQQGKQFLFGTHRNDVGKETSNLLFCICMLPINCWLLAIFSHSYASEHITRHFSVEPPILVVTIFFAAFLGYFLLKWLAYTVVNAILFSGKKRQQWNSDFLFITAIEGVLMFPLVFLLVYFDLSTKNALFYFGFILILNKMLAFHKGWTIFFKQNAGYLQIFLYFCALEAAPLLAFSGVWLALVNFLKVNF